MQEHILLLRAIRHLEIDVPVQAYELVSANIIRLALYGGKVVEYNAVEYNAVEYDARRTSAEGGVEYNGKISKRKGGHGN